MFQAYLNTKLSSSPPSSLSQSSTRKHFLLSSELFSASVASTVTHQLHCMRLPQALPSRFHSFKYFLSFGFLPLLRDCNSDCRLSQIHRLRLHLLRWVWCSHQIASASASAAITAVLFTRPPRPKLSPPSPPPRAPTFSSSSMQSISQPSPSPSPLLRQSFRPPPYPSPTRTPPPVPSPSPCPGVHHVFRVLRLSSPFSLSFPSRLHCLYKFLCLLHLHQRRCPFELHGLCRSLCLLDLAFTKTYTYYVSASETSSVASPLQMDASGHGNTISPISVASVLISRGDVSCLLNGEIQR